MSLPKRTFFPAWFYPKATYKAEKGWYKGIPPTKAQCRTDKAFQRPRQKEEQTGVPSVALELENGVIITGKKSDLFEASAAALINAVKILAKIPDDMPLLSFTIIEPIQSLKQNQLRRPTQRLYLDEVLITLAITGSTNAMAKKALEQLPKLSGSQMHSTVMLHPDDLVILKRLNIDVTTEVNQDTKLLQR